MSHYSFVSDDFYLFFECDTGWSQIIKEMLDEIQGLVDSDPETYADLNLVELKEKWGILRVTLMPYLDKISNIVVKYEKKSSHVCERCGNKGELRSRSKGGWLKTLCNTCFKEWEQL